MNNYPHLIEIDGPFDSDLYKQVCFAIEERFRLGPFFPTKNSRTGSRHVCIAKSQSNRLQIWENEGGLTPGPSVLFACIKQLIPGIVVTEINQLHPGVAPKWWRTMKRLRYALKSELQSQFFDDFIHTMPDRVATMFPLIRTDSKARLDLISAHVELPQEAYTPSGFQYHCYLKTRIQLIVLLDQDRSQAGRKQTITFANFPALTPDGTFIYRREHAKHAVDDFSQGFYSSLAIYVQDAQERLEHTSLPELPTLTPSKLFQSD